MPSCHSTRLTATGTRLCRGWRCLILLAVCSSAAQQARAALEDPADVPGPRIEFETLPHAMQPRAAVSGTRALFETPSDGLRTRMWWGRGALEVGAGADVHPTSTAPGLAASGHTGTAVVGLRAQVAQGTHLAIERDTLPTHLGAGAAAPVEGSRVALEFKAVGRSKAAKPLSSGLLRVQMSGTSTLQFKPRSGGLAVTYRAKF